jgi:D-2-hydroxyacid dehydrogenase (NADP+)
VTVLLVSHHLRARHGSRIAGAAARAAMPLEIVALPENSTARLSDVDCERVEAAFFSLDVFPDFSRPFFSAVRKAPRLRWLHVFNAGVDHPIYTEMLERGVRLTTSSGTASVPISQTAIMGLLALARGLPHWLEAQGRREWSPMTGAAAPRDLEGQTAVILGLGKIGGEIARLAKVLRLHVIGVRRGPRQPDDPVDELHPPSALADLAPRCDWLVIACPLTRETRGLVSAALLARLPHGAHLINISRGEIADEPAVVEALRSGRLAGAYLDVFATEPLPRESPLWDMPNAIVTPHNAGASAGNENRILELFLDNLARWHRGETLVNEIVKSGLQPPINADKRR